MAARGTEAHMSAQTRISRHGFTLIEVLVVIVIITLLMSILLVALSGARRSAANAAQRQSVVSLKMGVEQFKNDHGFLPPMVKDVFDCKYSDRGWSAIFKTEKDPIRKVGTDANGDDIYDPIVFSFSTAFQNRTTRDFLRGGSIDPDRRANADFRFSEYSLAYYLMGALGAEVDGLDGPGSMAPKSTGSFARKGGSFAPYYDIGNNTKGMVLNADMGGTCSASPLAQISRFELRDRNGIPFRYYRWLPGQVKPTSGPDESVVITSTADLNVPVLVGDAGENSDLRDAEYAIVAAGGDKAFGDIGTEDLDTMRTVLRVHGQTTAEKLKTIGRKDNIVEVGRK